MDAIPPDLERYHRQMLLADFGVAGQRRLAAGHAMVVGCGALGCPAADLLVRAGVGTVSIVDRDIVEVTNLQRQTLFDERDAAEAAPKAEAAARRLRAVNSGALVHALVEDFAGAEAERIVAPHPRPGVILDCTDNFEARYLINDVAVKLGVPYVYGGAVGTAGVAMTVLPGKTPCLRCVFPEAPQGGPTCDTAGVLAMVPSIIGACQALDAVKVLLGRADLLSGTLLSMDPWANQRRRLDLGGARRGDCPCCGERRFEFLDGARAARTRVLCGRNAVQVTPAKGAEGEAGAAGVARRLAGHGAVALAGGAVRVRPRGEDVELTVFADGRAIVAGTTDAARARAVYARYVGA